MCNGREAGMEGGKEGDCTKRVKYSYERGQKLIARKMRTHLTTPPTTDIQTNDTKLKRETRWEKNTLKEAAQQQQQQQKGQQQQQQQQQQQHNQLNQQAPHMHM